MTCRVELVHGRQLCRAAIDLLSRCCSCGTLGSSPRMLKTLHCGSHQAVEDELSNAASVDKALVQSIALAAEWYCTQSGPRSHRAIGRVSREV